MTINELLPSVATLSNAEKLRLVQMILQQLAQEERTSPPPVQPTAERFDPLRFYGAAHCSRQDVDRYLAAVRAGWNE